MSHHQMKPSELKETREKLLEEQNYICPLCNTEILLEDAALDHCHSSGLVRGVLHKMCNSAEGTIRSKFRRSGVSRYTTLEEYLYNLSMYLSKDHHPILHPAAAPRPLLLKKSSYNKLKKEINIINSYRKIQKKKPFKVPEYPKSKKLTKLLAELYEIAKIYPEYYL